MTEKTPKAPKEKKQPKAPKVKQGQSAGGEGESLLGLTVTKEANFGEWYAQLVRRAEMIENYDISGCFIIRPWAFAVWEEVQKSMDKAFKKKGVVNGYFPMLVTKDRLQKEESHIEGFAPEVAWVTKYGKKNLAQDLALRPTSETIMYPHYSGWIRSHRDLPLKINQWNSVMRWEFSQVTPFIRSREFLWQEGHTAHATDEEAEAFVFEMLEVYRRTYEDLLAVPVIKGIKSEGEKFAGAKFTSTVEAFVEANGRAVQAATSHHLGTNFAKMFDIGYEGTDRERHMVHQTSWGFTTRSIGVALMVHGDNKGAVLPPRVATQQVVIVPIIQKDSAELMAFGHALCDRLVEAGLRVYFDDRTNHKPGWKFNHWELKGVPLRFDIGPREMAESKVFYCRRDTGAKDSLPLEDIETSTKALLDAIHDQMLEKARGDYNAKIRTVSTWTEVMPALDDRCVIRAPWSEDLEDEKKIRAATTQTQEAAKDKETDEPTEEGTSALSGGMKPLCAPLEQEEMPEGTMCFFSGKPAKRWWLFGRSY